jgi:glycosyltransferase involved in cell wall biosynthesis
VSLKVIAWPAGGVNPYTNLLYTQLRALGAEVVDFSPARVLRTSRAIWHLHWPERMLNRRSSTAAALRAAALLALAFLARLRRTKLVWTVHNLSSHEYNHPWVERWFWPNFIRQLSGFISLSAAGKDLVIQRHPGLRRVPAFVIPHGHYRGAYPDTISQAEARAKLRLPLDSRIAAFVGHIRPYKNVPHLIQIFREIADPRVRLLLAGEPHEPGEGKELLKTAGNDTRVLLVVELIRDDELQVYLRAADLVVLPFSDILNSGSALLALSFDRPILVPRIGAVVDLERQLGPQWVRAYAGVLTADHLARTLEDSHERPLGRCEGIDRFGWDLLGRETWAAFHVLLHERTGRAATSRERISA